MYGAVRAESIRTGGRTDARMYKEQIYRTSQILGIGPTNKQQTNNKQTKNKQQTNNKQTNNKLTSNLLHRLITSLLICKIYFA